jgi:hypothetical protein
VELHQRVFHGRQLDEHEPFLMVCHVEKQRDLLVPFSEFSYLLIKLN